MSGRESLFSDSHRAKVFDSICTVWEYAVASLLPNADDLCDELARLQIHAGLTSRPHVDPTPEEELWTVVDA